MDSAELCGACGSRTWWFFVEGSPVRFHLSGHEPLGSFLVKYSFGRHSSEACRARSTATLFRLRDAGALREDMPL